jgi:heptosyltransferase-3
MLSNNIFCKKNPTRYHPERGSRLLHLFDRYLGIPLVYVAGKMRKKTLPSLPQPRRIGILQIACIGDTILLDGVIRDVKRTWPRAQVVLFSGNNNHEVAKLLTGLNGLIPLPIKRARTVAKKIRDAGSFDLWLDFGPWPRLNALFTLMSASTCKVGFMSLGQYRHYGYDIWVEHRSDIHELDNYRNLVRAVGVVPQSVPAFAPEFASLQTLPALDLDKPYVILHMFSGGSRSYMKEWPEQYWLEVGRAFLNRGWQVVLTGASNDRPRSRIVAKKLGGGAHVVDLAGRADLQQVAALLARARLVISVDTGTMHLASAVGASLIAIHGPTSPLCWGPISSKATVITPKDVSCAPCLHFGFEHKCNNNRCLHSISSQVVLDAASRFINSV